MIWLAVAVALVVWLAGVILRIGAWVNLFLMAAAVLLAYQIITERTGRSRDR